MKLIFKKIKYSYFQQIIFNNLKNFDCFQSAFSSQNNQNAYNKQRQSFRSFINYNN